MRKVAEVEIQMGFSLPERVFTNKRMIVDEHDNEIKPAFRLWTLDGEWLENDDDNEYYCLKLSENKDHFIELVPISEESEVQS